MPLSNVEIVKELGLDIVISPFNPDNLNSSSYDVTLGEYYYEASEQEFLNPWSDESIKRYYGDFKKALMATPEEMAKYGLTSGDRIIIVKPGVTILGHTEEFIGTVNNYTSSMQAKSSLGRCNISVCMCAGWGDVGYKNRWTMEIRNVGNTPVILIVGKRIAQIVFHHVGSSSSYSGKYNINGIWTPQNMLPKA
jgi:dCTP deaminase